MSWQVGSAINDSLRIKVTGFGPFQNVTHNHTSQLALMLGELPHVSSRALQTSFSAAQEYIDDECCEKCEGELVHLHLGIDCGSDGYGAKMVYLTYKFAAMERCGENLAQYRSADERGYQPCDIRIIQSANQQVLTTKIPVNDIGATLCDRYPVVISDNAGKFVCNTLYYLSLHAAQTLNGTAVLFVHCPPISAIPFDDQLAFLIELVGTLKRLRVNL